MLTGGKNIFFTAFVPYKEDKLETDMLKDVSHADVAKDDEIIDDTDPNYEDYYDVSETSNCLSLHFGTDATLHFRKNKMVSQRRRRTTSTTQQMANPNLQRLTKK